MAKLAPFKENNEGAAFAAGDTVVHPHHGAGRGVSRRRRRMLGSAARNYLGPQGSLVSADREVHPARLRPEPGRRLGFNVSDGVRFWTPVRFLHRCAAAATGGR